MLRGFATLSFFADDLVAASQWYSDLLGIEPYYQFPHEGPPAYVEFRVGDYEHELGIIDRKYAPHDVSSPAGAVIFWHVDDLPETLAKLESMGAARNEGPTDREDGFVTASVIDPFGNILGVMYNPHYLRILGKGSGGAWPR